MDTPQTVTTTRAPAVLIMVMVVDGVVVAMVMVTVVEAVCSCFGDFIPHRPPPQSLVTQGASPSDKIRFFMYENKKVQDCERHGVLINYSTFMRSAFRARPLLTLN